MSRHPTNLCVVGSGGHARDILHSRPGYYYQIETTESHEPPRGWVIFGINDPKIRAQASEAYAARWSFIEIEWVHPDAYVGPDCLFGKGTHVNYRASLTRTTLGDHVTVSPGATICGDVVIGDRVLIGAGSTICDRVTIGDDATVGAGAVVLPETIIPAGETWVGVPARKVRP